MRHTGKVTSWDDDRGFGFIEPKDGSSRVFLHISALSGRVRPRDGDVVVYKLGKDERDRPRATSARLNRGVHLSAGGFFCLSFASFFLAAIALGVLLKNLPPWILVAYLGASLLASIAYWRDKRRAQEGLWRVREDTLHVLEMLGGWPGALAAQHLLRHKNRKASFQFIFWIIVLLHLGFWGWYFRESRMVMGLLSLFPEAAPEPWEIPPGLPSDF